MRNAPLVAIGLFLRSDCGRALFPGVKYIGSKRGMASGLRRRLKQSSVPEANNQDQPSIGSLFWKRKSANNRAEHSRRDDVSLIPASDVIHLGKLRIPPSRRLCLNPPSRAPSDGSAESIAVARPSPRLSDAENRTDGAPAEIREAKQAGLQPQGRADGEIDRDSSTASEASPLTGNPSVIPCGIGENDIKKGVVQIPLQFTVGETVEFIRTVAMEDRDLPKVAQRDASERRVVANASEISSALGLGVHRNVDKGLTTLSSRIYVTEAGKLRGFITMAALLTHQPETPVASLLREMKELLREGDSWEDAAQRLRFANVMVAPVVDSNGTLVAVVNPGDLVKEMEIEATDDIMRQSGSGGGESYFGTPLRRQVASRVGWLVSLLCLQSLSSLILQNYQAVIEKNMVIALFLTMLTGTAGNAGNQSSAIVIRGLATGEINKENRWRVIWREARAAVASAVILSAASYGRVLMTPGATTIATLAVSMAMGATVIGAVMFGTVAPIVLDSLGVDPVNFASPALATLTDVSGVLILCSIAKMMLKSVA